MRFSYLRTLVLSSLVAFVCFGAYGQSGSERPIRLLIPVPPGGAGDLIARVLAKKMLQDAAASNEVKTAFAAQGIVPTLLGPAEYASFIRAENSKYSEIMRIASIKQE